ncbi:neurohypophysial n-terminal domain containing protein [Stylonychia lemnae]|uniref:Neurohypophysial n-terminal domain containing protein n=1 Tax=Stylonychia lemnae TaxID=5949 RepID=A0A078ALW6_STYLE|nr:neurohypophysial n-terminal domain containing protein [Stylonychia lemnae]|eukprot:CDW82377.1 neurohypophysial n-terminal domain containing protein [Stylonychia lemnae]
MIRDRKNCLTYILILLISSIAVMSQVQAQISDQQSEISQKRNLLTTINWKWITRAHYRYYLVSTWQQSEIVIGSLENGNLKGPKRVLQNLNPQPEPPGYLYPDDPVQECPTEIPLPPVTDFPTFTIGPPPETDFPPETTQEPEQTTTVTPVPTSENVPTTTQEVTFTIEPTSSSNITELPTETTVPTETIEPTETTVPTETIEPTETVEPSESTYPTETQGPTETLVPTEVASTTEQTYTLEPTQSPDVTEPGETTEPIITIGPTQSPNVTLSPEETTLPPQPTSSSGQIFAPIGCDQYESNGICTQCNLYSWLNPSDNSCNCFFNYKVEAEQIPVTSDTNDTVTNTYKLSVYTQLDLSQDLFSNDINCTDLLFFIFADSQTIEQLAPEVDLLTCQLYQIFYIVKPTGNGSYVNILEISNMTENVFQAFLNDDIELAYDYSVVDLQCYGAPELLVTYQGLQCTSEQDYCNNNQSENVNSILLAGKRKPGGYGLVYGVCNYDYNLTIINDQNLVDYGSPFSLQLDLQNALYNGQYLQDNQTESAVDCSDLISIQTFNDTDVDWQTVFFTQDLLTCTAEMIQINQQNQTIFLRSDNESADNTQYLRIKLMNLQEEVVNALNQRVFDLSLNLSNFVFINCPNEEQTLAIYQANNQTLVIPIQSNESDNFQNESGKNQAKFNCSSNCTSCDSSTGQCRACQQGYILLPVENDTNTCLLNPCEANQVYDIPTSQCADCPENCSSCDPQTRTCLDCAFGYFKLFSNYNQRRQQRYLSGPFQCVEQCPVDFFTDYDKSQCVLCDPDCGQCSGNPNYKCFWWFQKALCSAKSINEQTQKVQGYLRCVNNCPGGYYQVGGWCRSCKTNCDRCSNQATCQQCSSYYQLQNGDCVNNLCESNQFVNQRSQCQNCSDNCTSCTRNQNNCTSCIDGYVLQSGVCVEANQSLGGEVKCQTGFYYNLTQNRCLRCSPYCLSCSSSQDCDECSKLSYTLLNQTTSQTRCVSICPKGYYSSNAGRECKACLTKNCDVCAPQSNCWTCSEGFYKGRSSCFNTCPAGSFLSQDYLKYYQCSNCAAPCQRCNSRDTCSSCAAPYIKVTSQFSDIKEEDVQKILKKSCVYNASYCPDGTFYSAQRDQCILCPRGCALCDKTGQCTGYCNNQTRCQDCISKPAQCIQCPEGFVLIQSGDNVSCRRSCQGPGIFYDEKSLSCQNCSQNCQSCNDSIGCNRCGEGYYKQIDGNGTVSCVANCLDGYYGNNQSRQCVRCQRNCQLCDSAAKCLTCDAQTSLDPNTGRCYCALRYTAYLSSQSDNVQVSFQNVNWNSQVSQIFGNPEQLFNCSEIFDFNQVNNTIAANPPYDNSPDALENLQCTASYLPDANAAEIQIYNVSQTLQTLIRLKLVTIGLRRGVYIINCVQFKPLTLSFAPANRRQTRFYSNQNEESNSNENCSGNGRRLLQEQDAISMIQTEVQNDQLVETSEKEEIQYSERRKEIQYSQKLNICLLICVIMILGVVIAKKILNSKKNEIIYQRQDSEVEMENKEQAQKEEVQLLY